MNFNSRHQLLLSTHTSPQDDRTEVVSANIAAAEAAAKPAGGGGGGFSRKSGVKK